MAVDTTHPRTTFPLAARAAVALLVLFGILWLVDSIVAMRAEARISAFVEEEAELATSPDVNLGGFPYTYSLISGKIPVVTITSLDINIEGLGIVNARTEVRDVKVDRHQALNGDLVGNEAELFTRLISLDGVALGQLLDMTDLDIANPYDISPAGGVASEAQLTGTPQGFDEEVSALVSLRLRGSEFSMEVLELLNAPPERLDEARAAFTYSMDTRRLPLRQQASSVEVSGGSVVFSAQQHGFRLNASDLAPLDFGDAAAAESSAWESVEEADRTSD